MPHCEGSQWGVRRAKPSEIHIFPPFRSSCYEWFHMEQQFFSPLLQVSPCKSTNFFGSFCLFFFFFSGSKDSRGVKWIAAAACSFAIKSGLLSAHWEGSERRGRKGGRATQIALVSSSPFLLLVGDAERWKRRSGQCRWCGLGLLWLASGLKCFCRWAAFRVSTLAGGKWAVGSKTAGAPGPIRDSSSMLRVRTSTILKTGSFFALFWFLFSILGFSPCVREWEEGVFCGRREE